VKLLAGVSRNVANSTLVKHVTNQLVRLYPGQQYEHVREFLDVFQSHHIAHAARVYADEMERAEIDMCVPLTMNLFNAAPRSRDTHILEYEDQVLHTALEAAKHPWMVWPFVMFDPRRPNALEIVQHALTRCGCIGVKMYPALGYHPDPDETAHANDADQLRKLYDICRDGRVPITTHASTGGAYSTELTPAQACRYTEIDNWERPIREYGLKVNFAHFGGNYIDNKASQSWRAKIINLMRRTHDGSMRGRVFADLSYQELAFDPKHKHQYFKDLKDALQDKAVAASVLFGTDWNMTAQRGRNQSTSRHSAMQKAALFRNLSVRLQRTRCSFSLAGTLYRQAM